MTDTPRECFVCGELCADDGRSAICASCIKQRAGRPRRPRRKGSAGRGVASDVQGPSEASAPPSARGSAYGVAQNAVPGAPSDATSLPREEPE